MMVLRSASTTLSSSWFLSLSQRLSFFPSSTISDSDRSCTGSEECVWKRWGRQRDRAARRQCRYVREIFGNKSTDPIGVGSAQLEGEMECVWKSQHTGVYSQTQNRDDLKFKAHRVVVVHRSAYLEQPFRAWSEGRMRHPPSIVLCFFLSFLRATTTVIRTKRGEVFHQRL